VIVTGGEYAAGLALLRGVRAGGDEPVAAVTGPDALADPLPALRAAQRSARLVATRRRRAA
jgi:hypothetical protein